VSRYLLDTNVLSEANKPSPSASVGRWVEAQAIESLFIATFALAEIERGILQRASGQKRRDLDAWFRGPHGPHAVFAGRILSFDERAASQWARLMSEGVSVGRPRSGLDMIVAATAAANDCVVVTLNERHFAGVVPFLNPASL